MMPNKRNPDPAELVRGRAARVIGALTAVLALLKGLPLAYQRDLQEDKPPLFGAMTIWEASLGVMAGLIETLTIDRDRMRAAADQGYTTATAVADALVRRGVPFRAAHHVVGSLVARAETGGLALERASDSMITASLSSADDRTARELAAEPDIGGEVRAAASIETAIGALDVVGGTAPNRVSAAIAAARARLGD
jgi:argininosuccinate lyase